MKRSIFLAITWVILTSVQCFGGYIVDTGPGPASNYTSSWALGSWQWLAGKFTVSKATTITNIEGWMRNNSINNDQTPIIAKIYTDGGSVPGQELHAAQFSVNPQVGWYGPSGLNWTLQHGTYWVAFEASYVGKTGYWVEMPEPCANPLSGYASVNWGWNNGMQYGVSVPLNFALRISSNDVTTQGGTTSVPVMNGWWLLPGMLAGIGIFARRKKE